MPNWCSYEAMFEGRKKDLQTLFKWMNADYDYSGNKSEIYLINTDNSKTVLDHHVGFRVQNCDYDENFLNSFPDDEVITINAVGTVAWSLHSCLFKGEYTYPSMYSIFKNLNPFKKIVGRKSLWKCIKETIKRRKALTLDKACKMLNIKAELYSTESGMGFAEHYCIAPNGKILVNQEAEYREIYIGDYDCYENFIKGMKEQYPDDKVALSITEEEFNNADCIIEKCKWLVNGYFPFNYVSY